MTTVKLDTDRLVAGRFSVELVRTLRVPAEGGDYPLPPGFGAFPLYSVEHLGRSRRAARELQADFVVPLYQFEALWLRFEAAEWKPNAVQIWSGGVNALTGESYPSSLRRKPQNYIVCPTQPWLDGFRTGPHRVRQFVAAPLGTGATVQEQLGGADPASLRLRVYEPYAGLFPDRRPRGYQSSSMYEELPMGTLGLAGGGSIEQDVYADPHPPRTWNAEEFADITIQIVNSATFRSLIGKAPPPSPISAEDYTRLGLPWFRYYDEASTAVTGVSAAMKRIKPLDAGGRPVTPRTVRTLRRSRKKKSR